MLVKRFRDIFCPLYIRKMDYIKSPKISYKFNCQSCDYNCCRQSEFSKHNLTQKHQKKTEKLQIVTEELQMNTSKNLLKFICGCGKEYKHRQGLWKHKQKCHSTKGVVKGTEIVEGIIIKSEPTDKEIIMMLIEKNENLTNELKTIVVEQNKMIQEQNKTFQEQVKAIQELSRDSKTTMKSNETFNLQTFLNVTCENAMNITEFIETIKPELKNLERLGEIGFVKGISDIIVNSVKKLNVSQRPFHVTDAARGVVYVKNENKWAKDETKVFINKVIQNVETKTQRLLAKFKEAHPDCIKYHSKFSDQYNKLVVEAMGGSGDNDEEKHDKIYKCFLKSIVLNK